MYSSLNMGKPKPSDLYEYNDREMEIRERERREREERELERREREIQEREQRRKLEELQRLLK